MPREQYLEQPQVEAFRRFRSEFDPLWNKRSPVLRVPFQGEGTVTEVRHGMGLVPTGFLQLNTRSLVIAAPGRPWTTELAYLMSGSVASLPGSGKIGDVLVVFFVTEPPINATTGQREGA